MVSKTLDAWLGEYGASHRNRVNKTLHWICIPPIVFSMFAALKAIPLGGDLFNPATSVAVLALAYYLLLSWRLGVGMTAVFCVLYAGVLALEATTGEAMLWWAAGVFGVAWIGQFIGHYFEGAKPSFFKDLQFLLIGPLWLLAFVYRYFSIPTQTAQLRH